MPARPNPIEGRADDKDMRSAAILISSFALAGVAHSALPALAEGGGTGPAAGVTVSDVRYELDAGAGVRAVGFAVAPASVSLVRARVEAGAAYVACTRAGARWRCPLGGVPFERVQALAVVAADA
jgi:hypothetical protein